MALPLAAVAGAALVGGIAGGMKDKSSSTSISRVFLDEESENEIAARKEVGSSFSALQDLVGASAGQSDVEAGLQSQRSLAEMLEAYSKGGFMPGQSDINTANAFTRDIFAPQQEQLRQSFQDQEIEANRLAAQLGRPVNDPILRAKLAQQQTREQSLLSSQMTAFSAQEARNLPLQRLGFATDLANVRGQLATQAMNNRSALLSAGQNLQAMERDWRLNTATRVGEATQTSGGGLKGALGGALAFGGAAMGMPSMLGGMGGGAAAAGAGGGLATGNTMGFSRMAAGI